MDAYYQGLIMKTFEAYVRANGYAAWIERQVALSYGADDLHGTIIEEHIFFFFPFVFNPIYA